MGRWRYESRTAITACLVASSRRIIPGSRTAAPPRSRSTAHQLRQLPLRGFVVGRGDQGFLDPIAGAQLIAARLQLPPESQVRLGMSPTRSVDTRGRGRVEQLRGQLQLRERLLPQGAAGLGLA